VACIVKHMNPCGAANDDSTVKAILRAKEGDPVSAYGGILGVSFEVGMAEAKEISKTFLEVVVAPKFTPEAARELAAKKKLRLFEIGEEAFQNERTRILEAAESGRDLPLRFASSPFGFLVQEEDLKLVKPAEIEVVSDLPLRPSFKPDIMFGLTVIRFLKSNSIALFKDLMMVGAGMGQPSRVDATKIALEKAGKRASGALMVSDGFFPFADSIEIAHKAGVTIAVAPKGSIRDHEVIQRANDLKLCLVFVPQRHFLH
jgi:phosphoribosylaminoimidazolecarboxamide formyltransferase / IMP cyclohydrolase